MLDVFLVPFDHLFDPLFSHSLNPEKAEGRQSHDTAPFQIFSWRVDIRSSLKAAPVPTATYSSISAPSHFIPVHRLLRRPNLNYHQNVIGLGLIHSPRNIFPFLSRSLYTHHHREVDLLRNIFEHTHPHADLAGLTLPRGRTSNAVAY